MTRGLLDWNPGISKLRYATICNSSINLPFQVSDKGSCEPLVGLSRLWFICFIPSNCCITFVNLIQYYGMISVVFSGYSSFLHQYNWPPQYSWNIVESGVTHQEPKPTYLCVITLVFVLRRIYILLASMQHQ
jgi:hypothetical protein